MYRFEISDRVIKSLRDAASVAKSIPDKLNDLAVNPVSNAISTGIPIIGSYYINAGRYCILFDINNDEQIVSILSIVPNSYLYRVLTGRIDP